MLSDLTVQMNSVAMSEGNFSMLTLIQQPKGNLFYATCNYMFMLYNCIIIYVVPSIAQGYTSDMFSISCFTSMRLGSSVKVTDNKSILSKLELVLILNRF